MSRTSSKGNEERNREFERLLATGGDDLMTTEIRKGNADDEARIQTITAAARFSNEGLERLRDGKCGEAISMFWMSLAYERTLRSPFRLANDYGNLGTAYLRMGYMVEARAALDESIRLYALANSSTGAAKTYYWLAQWEIRVNNLPQAHEFARRSLLLFEKHSHSFTDSARKLFAFLGAQVSNQSDHTR